jgi:transcriptional regulator with XRE-family HTH domain
VFFLRIETKWFIIIVLIGGGGIAMKTSDMIRQVCEQMNISISELARRLGQSPQNFGKKLKRETITLEELKAIADVLDVKFEQAFILPDGKEIKVGSE